MVNEHMHLQMNEELMFVYIFPDIELNNKENKT